MVLGWLFGVQAVGCREFVTVNGYHFLLGTHLPVPTRQTGEIRNNGCVRWLLHTHKACLCKVTVQRFRVQGSGCVSVYGNAHSSLGASIQGGGSILLPDEESGSSHTLAGAFNMAYAASKSLQPKPLQPKPS